MTPSNSSPTGSQNSSQQRPRKKSSGFVGTLVALVAVIALGAYAYFIDYEGGKKKEDQKVKDSIALKFDSEKATRIEISAAGRVLALEKKADGWFLAQPVQDMADSGAVHNMLSVLSSEKAIETVAEGDEAKPEKYGLAEPTGRITVKTEDGKSHEIKIGAKSFDADLYAQVDAEKKVILVSSLWDVQVAKQAKDLRDKRLLRAENAADIDSIELSLAPSKGQKSTTTLRKDGGKWIFVEPRTAPFPVSQESAQSFLDALRSLRADEFPSEDKSDSAVLKKLGLAAPEISVQLKAGEKKTWRLQVAAEAQVEKGKQAAEPASLRAAISTDVPALLQLAKSSLAQIEKKPEDFYDRRAPFQFPISDASQASIRTPQLALELKRSGDSWVFAEGKAIEGKDVDSAKVKDLLAHLVALSADRVLAKNEKPKGLEAPRNQIVLKNEKGDTLLDLAWGEEFKVPEEAAGAAATEPPLAKGSPRSPRGRPGAASMGNAKKAERDHYFVETKAKGAGWPAFGTRVSAIDALPIKDLVKEKPAIPGVKPEGQAKPNPNQTIKPTASQTASQNSAAPPVKSGLKVNDEAPKPAK